MPTPEAVIQATGLHKAYHDGARELKILVGLDFQLAPGESAAILGRSGTGKTTLLNLLGLLDRPEKGRLSVLGVDTAKWSNTRRRRCRGAQIGFVFQQHHLLADLSALDNVLLAGNFAARRPPKKRAMALLAAVGLEERLTHKPAKLSGGEQQRVAVARALFNCPALLLCDEPTGSLDPQTGGAVMEMLFNLAQAENTALVLVTHDRQVAASATRQLELAQGRLRPSAPTALA